MLCRKRWENLICKAIYTFLEFPVNKKVMLRGYKHVGIRRHQQLLESYRVSDTQAYMSRFYPQIKREIIDSWDRLFDDSVHLNSDQRYGIIWEIKKEWVSAVLR